MRTTEATCTAAAAAAVEPAGAGAVVAAVAVPVPAAVAVAAAVGGGEGAGQQEELGLEAMTGGREAAWHWVLLVRAPPGHLGLHSVLMGGLHTAWLAEAPTHPPTPIPTHPPPRARARNTLPVLLVRQWCTAAVRILQQHLTRTLTPSPPPPPTTASTQLHIPTEHAALAGARLALILLSYLQRPTRAALAETVNATLHNLQQQQPPQPPQQQHLRRLLRWQEVGCSRFRPSPDALLRAP